MCYLARQAQLNGGLPPGADLSPDMVRSMADRMANMPPEEMDSMLAAVDATRAAAPSSANSSTQAGASVAPSAGLPAGAGVPQSNLAASAMQVGLWYKGMLAIVDLCTSCP